MMNKVETVAIPLNGGVSESDLLNLPMYLVNMSMKLRISYTGLSLDLNGR